MTPEEQETNNSPAEPASAPVVTNSAGIGLKELLVPLSILFAGAFVGLGLYFGGGNSPLAEQPAVPSQEQPADTTDQVAEVDASDWIKGDPNAEVVIVEYSDFDCPFCSRFHDTMNQIVAESDGQVAWVYRHFPLDQLHPQARAVSLAAECVGAEGGSSAFWQFTDRYFEVRGQRDATPHAELIPQLVTETGVNQAAFTACFENGTYNEKIQAHMDNAVATGGRGTPWSVLIGPDGSTYPVNGAQPKAAIEQIISIALEES